MRFLETLFRHRLIAILPVVIGVLVAAGYEMGQPRSFTSTADIWVDATTPSQAGSTNYNYTDPSTQQQLAIQELLKSRSFDVAVGKQSGLGAFLAKHPGAETTGIAALPVLKVVFAGAPPSVDDQLSTIVPAVVTVTSTGPQVDAITATGPTPAIAAATATAVVQQYSDQVVQAQTASDQLAVTYYQQQVNQADATLTQAEQALKTYLASHPKIPADGTGDATATELIQAADDARTSYQSLLGQYNQAQLTLESVGNNIGFRVLDPAQPGTPVSIKKKLLGAGVAGLLVGIIVSLLIVSGLTAADRTARRAEDIKRALGLEVAASIGQAGPLAAVATPGGEL
jgi:uncharacterized protein involved in exopolysaccharide biosynthesis